MNKSNAEIQRALIARNHDLGSGGPSGRGDDGVWGGKSRTAMMAYQTLQGLRATGVADTETLRRLFPGEATTPSSLPPWYLEMQRRKGLHETLNRPSLMAWLRSDGTTLGDPAKLPWCGDAVETAIHLTLPNEPRLANPYMARHWMRFGRPLKAPAIGAVLVFWRGARDGISGHVGLYAGEDAGALHVLGGNQSNAITVARLGRDRLLGIRWPQSYPLPTTGSFFGAAEGGLSTDEA